MTIPLTGTGGLMTRLGKIGAIFDAVNLFRGTGALQLASLTGNGTTSTATTIRNHGLTTGDTVTIAGAATSAFNGSFTITVTSNTAFTYLSAANTTDTSTTITATKTAGVGYFAVGPYVDNIEGQYQGTNQQLVDTLYSTRDSYRSVHSSFETYLQSLCQSTLIKMADDDVRLGTKDVPTAINTLVSQMTKNAQSVKKPTLTILSSQATISAPVQSAAAAAAGGAVTAGTYFYKITATTLNGETVGSNEQSATTAGGNLTVNLSWTQPVGPVTGYKVYRGTVTNTENVLVTTITNPTTLTYSDVALGQPAGTPPGSNTGFYNNTNGQVVASLTNVFGLQLDYALAEVLTLTCTADSQGSATLNSEPFAVTGPIPEPDPTMWDYPLGSGVNVSLSAVDASLSNAANVLSNSSFDTFTVTNTPDNWTIGTGTPGTTIFNGGSGQAFVTSGSCLQFTGNGSELTAIFQPTNVTTNGTAYKFLPHTVYAYNFWYKVSSVPGAGVLELALTDGSGNILVNDQNVSLSKTQALTAGTTTYQAVNGVFQTPAVLPSTVRVRLRLSTALSNAVSVYVDTLAFTASIQIYPGGPYVAFFAGSNKAVAGDTYTITVTNLYDSRFQLLMDRIFGLRSLAGAPQIPSSSSPTIADSLIA